MKLYRDHGIVVRTHLLGEADRIVVFVTRSNGKVRAVAKGVRRTRSRFGARLEPTTHVALQLYRGRELDTVTQAEIIDHFPALRGDLVRFAKASAAMEAVDAMAQEHQPSERQYEMLLGALRALDRSDAPLLVPAFFLRLLAAEGMSPVVDQCVSCGATDELVAFDPAQGGVLCRRCRRGVALSAPARDLLERILTGPLADLLAQPASATTAEVERLATTTLEHFIERHLRSVRLIDLPGSEQRS